MGLFSFFTGKKDSTKNTFDGTIRRAKDIYIAPELRRASMEELIANGSHDALEGVLQRFDVVAASPHWDAEEKKWLVDALVGLGDKAITPVVNYVTTRNSLAHPLTALKKMLTDEIYLDTLTTALLTRSPEDYRNIEGKVSLITELASLRKPQIFSKLRPYLHDHSDDTQCAAIDAFKTLWPLLTAQDKETLQQDVQTMLADDTRSSRVLRALARTMHQLNIPVDVQKAIPAAVLEDFVLQGDQLTPLHTA